LASLANIVDEFRIETKGRLRKIFDDFEAIQERDSASGAVTWIRFC